MVPHYSRLCPNVLTFLQLVNKQGDLTLFMNVSECSNNSPAGEYTRWSHTVRECFQIFEKPSSWWIINKVREEFARVRNRDGFWDHVPGSECSSKAASAKAWQTPANNYKSSPKILYWYSSFGISPRIFDRLFDVRSCVEWESHEATSFYINTVPPNQRRAFVQHIWPHSRIMWDRGTAFTTY